MIIPLKIFKRWLLLIVAAVFVYGCNVAKKNERKDKEALERVTAKKSLLDQAAAQYIDNHPPVIHTNTITTPGAPIPVLTPVRDTARERRIVDSVKALKKECGDAAKEAFNLGYEEAQDKFIKIIAETPCPPSTKTVETDLTEIKRLQDIINQLKVQAARAEGHAAATTEQLKESKNETANRSWVILGLVALLAVSLYLHISGLIPKLWGKVTGIFTKTK